MSLSNALYSIKENRFNIGVVLISQGLALTNLIRAIAGQNLSSLVNIIMALGVLLMFDYRELRRLRLHIHGSMMVITTLFMLYTLARALIVEYTYSDSANIIYTIFGVALALALSTNTEWKNEENFVPILFFVSGILSIVCAWFFTDGFTNFTSSINGIYDSSGTLIADRLTMSGIPFTSLITCICYKAKSNKILVLKFIFALTSVMCMFIVMRRALILSLIVAVLYAVYAKAFRKKEISMNSFLRAVAVLAAIIIIVFILSKTEWFGENLTRLVEFTQRGFGTLFGNTSYGVDASAQTRVNLRNQILDEYSSYSIAEMLFGKGYMYMYLDFPLLQAFIDLGITGGVFYLIIVLIYPVKRCLRPYADNTGLYLQLTILRYVFNAFYVGIPYGYSVYFPCMLLMFYAYLSRKRAREALYMEEADIEGSIY